MVEMMLLAHLLGDYVFQTDGLVRWKMRSMAGLVAHGAIVTLWLWLCSLPFTLSWWPYALAVGVTHTLIDIVRARLGQVKPTTALILLLLDQILHLGTIAAALAWSGWLQYRPAETALGLWLQADHHLAFIAGYVLLTMPAWVLVHFVVRGMGAESTSLPGRPGEKYIGMLERALIATFVLLDQFMLIPLVVVPRLAMDGYAGQLKGGRLGYLNELLVSISLALAVGLLLRGLL
ncbi:MAG: DUF3307 domain-containing protein [Chloroflexia bacterium]|nr:DUF3307 domain-containing protein [Chloroflexia bacterium]